MMVMMIISLTRMMVVVVLFRKSWPLSVCPLPRSTIHSSVGRIAREFVT